jgi:hypothetical protein
VTVSVQLEFSIEFRKPYGQTATLGGHRKSPVVRATAADLSEG